jgi:hypothetical protein
MRRIIVLFALMVSVSSPVQADTILPGQLFVPESVRVDIAGPLFGNETNTFCWRCGDAIPSNDLQLVLQGSAPLFVEGYPNFFGADSLGSLSVNGPAPNFDGLNVSFRFDVTTTVTTQIHVDDQNRPEDLPNPSVATGSLTGNLFGAGGRRLIVTYGGRVDGVRFSESSNPFENIFEVPLSGGVKSFTSEIFVDPEIPFTPGASPPTPTVTPEPTSLLLLGSALAAAAFKARRARR